MIKELKIYWKLRPIIKQFKELTKMKFSLNVVIQILMLILQGYNQISDMLDPETRQVATLIMGIIQAVVALLAHYRNPDGTPAKAAYIPKPSSKIPSILMIVGLGTAFFLPALANAQEVAKPKFGVFGLSVDSTSEKSLAGWGALGLGLTQDIISYTDFDVSVVRGTTLEQALKNEGLQYTFREGAAVRIPLGLPKWLSVWGLGNAGVAVGGLTGAEGQTVIAGSFAGGGIIHIGVDRVAAVLILQVEKNPTTGRMFIPRAGIKIKL